MLGVNRETFCTFELPSSREADLETGLKKAVLLMEARGSSLEEIVSDGGVVELYVGLFLDGADSAGITMPPAAAERIARLRLTTTIEIYSEPAGIWIAGCDAFYHQYLLAMLGAHIPEFRI